MDDAIFNNFYLGGSASLSLQIGHRKPKDIDLFFSTTFDHEQVRMRLEDRYNAKIMWSTKLSMGGYIDKIKYDILPDCHPALKPVCEIDGIRLIS